MSAGSDKSAAYAYLDLLALALGEHEKNLVSLIERLDSVITNLSKTIIENKERNIQSRVKHKTSIVRRRKAENIESLLKSARNISSESEKS